MAARVSFPIISDPSGGFRFEKGDPFKTIDQFCAQLEAKFDFSPAAREKIQKFIGQPAEEGKQVRWDSYTIEQVGTRAGGSKPKYYLAEDLECGKERNVGVMALSRKGNNRWLSRNTEYNQLASTHRQIQLKHNQNGLELRKMKGPGDLHVNRLMGFQDDMRVCDFAPGSDLNTYVVCQKPTDAAKMTAYFQLFLGLSFIHQSGFTHNDVKPPNIHVDPRDIFDPQNQGKPLLTIVDTEFLAKPAEDDPNVLEGTIDYLSPEAMKYTCIRGDLRSQRTKDVWPKEDVWSAMITVGEVELDVKYCNRKSLVSDRYLNAFEQYINLSVAGKSPDFNERILLCNRRGNLFNLFGEPQTFMDLVLFVSAYTNPQYRWSSSDVVELFRLGAQCGYDLQKLRDQSGIRDKKLTSIVSVNELKLKFVDKLQETILK